MKVGWGAVRDAVELSKWCGERDGVWERVGIVYVRGTDVGQSIGGIYIYIYKINNQSINQSYIVRSWVELGVMARLNTMERCLWNGVGWLGCVWCEVVGDQNGRLWRSRVGVMSGWCVLRGGVY